MEGRGVSRRTFLKLSSAALVAGSVEFPFRMLTGVESVDNPLQLYVERGWEKVYRDQYSYTDTFTFLCAPQRHSSMSTEGLCSQRRRHSYRTEL